MAICPQQCSWAFQMHRSTRHFSHFSPFSDQEMEEAIEIAFLIFHIAVAMDCRPFGMDDSYRAFLLWMFNEGDEEPGLDDSYRTFLLWMFHEGEEGENGRDGSGLVDQQEEDVEAGEDVFGAHEIEIELEDDGEDALTPPPVDIDHPNRQGRIEDFDPPARLLPNKYATIYALAASLTTISLAYVQLLISGSAPYFKTDLALRDSQLQLMTAILAVSSLLGLVLARLISDKFGRRWTIVTAGAIYFVGPVIMGSAQSYVMLLFGRSLANLGASFALTIAPVYATEISPIFSRGILISFPEVCISFGTLFGNLSNYIFSKFLLEHARRLVLSTGAIPSVVLLLAFIVFHMPESPEWLIMRGHLGLAKPILSKTSRSEEETALRLAQIKKDVGIPEECDQDIVDTHQNMGAWRDILHPTKGICHMLLCTIVIQFVQQACSIDTMMLFAPIIFGKLGIMASTKRLLVSLMVDLLKIPSVLFATYFVDRLGRRWLLLSSIGGVVISLVSFGACLRFIEASNTRPLWAIVTCLVTGIGYVISFSIGLAPIAAVYCSEIFPTRLRAQGYTIGVGVKQTVNIGLSLSYIWLAKAITLGGTAISLAFIALVVGLLLYWLMPETSGKTVEEIKLLFGNYKQSIQLHEGVMTTMILGRHTNC
ncbi:hypothetical protein EUGRSUZ_G00341 [Eucalyptus grandis]|uniref:Uncharacterized protein n=2 Tax=Eucalyptus grandis TaxID=71139 RepID=A0ACC3K2E3_EUCGR|nr:hypothetical protein EUGRSUZ_G00341 [Eucalyptus grandis]